MSRSRGWDERDYRLVSQIRCLPSFGLIGDGDHMVSLKQVERTIENLAANRTVKAEASSTEPQRCRRCNGNKGVPGCVNGDHHTWGHQAGDCIPCASSFHAPSDPAQQVKKEK